MLLCSLDDIRAGVMVGAVVLHPRRPEMELLAPGTVLDANMIGRLRELGVPELWIRHDALADLDALLTPRLTELRREVYCRIKEDFASLEAQTISSAQILEYRQAMLRLVFELVGNRKVAGLTDQLFGAEHALFLHATNVAYLATLTGLELEAYLVAERRQLATEHARDVANLGLGAMLHDIGKAAAPEELRGAHEVVALRPAPPASQLKPAYAQHVLAGYHMLRDSKAPASAKQVVLNHHQRFDGQGWPDLAEFRADRKAAPLKGREIHIFCRIVSAVNVLDNLLRDAGDARRPAVAALYDFQSKAFDGWFDPVVRLGVVRRMPPFQIGAHVVLSNGQNAAVVAPSLNQPCRPVVRLLDDAARLKDGRYPTVELEKRPELRIAQCAGVDVRRWYFELPVRKVKTKVKVG